MAAEAAYYTMTFKSILTALRKGFIMTLALLLFASCSEDAAIERQIRSMTLEQKIGQMFWVRAESLNYGRKPVVKITPEILKSAEQYPAGGVVLFAENCVDSIQLKELVDGLHSLPGNPLISMDEEGGQICRIAGNPSFLVRRLPSMTELCAMGQDSVRQAASYIGGYLSHYGIDIDLAPVSDVNSNPSNPVIGTRAFSNDPEKVSQMVCQYLDGLSENGVQGCLKHFPGHGDTASDTHKGTAYSFKSLSELRNCELIPFKAGIEHGARIIMTAHIIAPKVDSTAVPSTLSPAIIEGLLRGELGYEGVVVTDGMGMKAISDYYSVEEAAIKAVEAGVDVLLCPPRYAKAFDAVKGAVQSGRISEERINQSVKRILLLKRSIGKE